MRRVLSILAEFKAKTGHEHPKWQTVIANYRRLLEDMKLPQEEIDRRIREVTQRPQHLPES